MSEEVSSAMVIHELREALKVAQADAAALRELYDDVERWRSSGGDVRDLRYVLETADSVRPEAGAALLAELKTLREIADIAADYVNAPANSYDLERVYEALEQAVRRWKASVQ